MKKLKFPKDRKVSKTVQTKKCVLCGKSIMKSVRRGYKWAISKYCSIKCSGLGSRTKELRVCKVCKKTYEFKPSQLHAYKGAGQFCSKKCHGDSQAEQWKGAPVTDKYGRTHRREDNVWKKAVREKNDYTCQRCGKYSIYISAHHINPRGRRRDLKHDVTNGMCLCGSCHTWVHHHPKLATELGFLSSAKYEAKTN